MDPRVEIYQAALSHQTGAGFDFAVYQGRSQYGQGFNFPVFRGQTGNGFIGDALKSVWHFFRPIAMTGAKTLLKAGGEALKDGATVKEVLSNTLKPAVGAVLASTAEQVTNKFLIDKPTAAPGPAPAIGPPPGTLVAPVPPQTGSGKRRMVYKPSKRSTKRISRHLQPYNHSPIHYNF
jgi:hypothetical protein